MKKVIKQMILIHLEVIKSNTNSWSNCKLKPGVVLTEVSNKLNFTGTVAYVKMVFIIIIFFLFHKCFHPLIFISFIDQFLSSLAVCFGRLLF